MANTLRKLLKAMLGSLRDLMPIFLVIVFFQFAVLDQPLPNVGELLVGVVFVVLGLTFFIPPLSEVIGTLFEIIGTPAFLKAEWRNGGVTLDDAKANTSRVNFLTHEFL